jgi:D-lactate dehydrogenase (cytochrome)
VLVRALSEQLGADSVVTAQSVLDQHGRDESYHAPAAPDVVAYPESTDEVAAIVRTCREHGVPIVPFGAGSSLEGHVLALYGGVSVDMTRMNRILRMSIEDLDVTVEAGVTRKQLDARLRPEGLFFPVDPGADATIGGMVATGASGTTTVRYGAMRENVLSLVVVTGEGEIVRTRSRARKSSAGYDLTRLFVGSEGTLGVVCEATLRAYPTPEAMSAATCVFPTLRAAVDCVIAVLQLGVPVARIELADEVQMQAIDAYEAEDYTVAPTLFLEFHGSPQEVHAHAQEVQAVAAEQGGEEFRRATDESERRALWRARHRAYNASLALRPGAAGLTTDACVPISALADCIEETQRDLTDHGLVGTIVGHVGDGNFHVVVLMDREDPSDVQRALDFGKRLAVRAIGYEGTCTGEHGVGLGKAPYLELEHGVAGVRLMRAVKRALDPEGLFNPGKVADAQDR